MTKSAPRTIAVIGGTGDLGSGLAKRWAAAGRNVVIGTRDVARGEATVETIRTQLRSAGLPHALATRSNAQAAAEADVVVVAVRFAHQQETLEAIKSAAIGKVLIDATVPLAPPRVMRVQLPPEGSAAQRSQQILGPEVKVVSAFQNVAAHHLHTMEDIPCDVIVTGDDADARDVAVGLAEAAGMRAVHGGALCNAAAAEALTSLLIFMNKQYGAHAGIKITGL